MTTKPLFPLGRLVATPGALEALRAAGLGPAVFLSRHVTLEPGVLCPEDQQTNRQALIHGDRIFSAFMCGEEKLYVITEADRSVTTILLPEEY